MSWIFIGLAVILLVLLEHYWAPYALSKLRIKSRCDSLLSEPGQVLTWTSEVTNTSILPIPFARLVTSFPVDSTLREEEQWGREHCKASVTLWHTEDKLSLMPRSTLSRKVHFSIDRRGVYKVGNHQLSAGDILGFQEERRTGEGESIVVMPERSKDHQALQALGGFLGDVSVRRFILEDPVLTIGFRDYTGREPLKSVSWKRTAMTGTMQVKQFDHTSEQTVMVLLNVEGGNDKSLEECFRLTRSVCEELERKKIPFGLRTNGNLPGPVGKIFLLQDGLGENHLNNLLYGLGRADYTCYFSFLTLVRQALQRRKNNESYILITPQLDHYQQAAQRMLSEVTGSQVCLLVGREEEETK